MAQAPDSNVSYLQALKLATDAAAPAPARDSKAPASSKAGPSGISQRYTGAEKRRSPRYKCEGSAEMRQDGVDLRTWATFTDLSLHGCYVEATATYPVGTLLHVKLEANGLKVQAKGHVRVTYPYLGMGIAFSEVSEDDRSQLRDLLRSISRPSVILGSRASSVEAVLQRSEFLPPVTNPAATIKAMVQFFDQRQLLTRDEFSRLLRKSQEP
ncbi:MAG: PilZ domain-containing protein [Candidatus Sulfotelmatobacter sp.]